MSVTDWPPVASLVAGFLSLLALALARALAALGRLGRLHCKVRAHVIVVEVLGRHMLRRGEGRVAWLPPVGAESESVAALLRRQKAREAMIRVKRIEIGNRSRVIDESAQSHMRRVGPRDDVLEGSRIFDGAVCAAATNTAAPATAPTTNTAAPTTASTSTAPTTVPATSGTAPRGHR